MFKMYTFVMQNISFLNLHYPQNRSLLPNLPRKLNPYTIVSQNASCIQIIICNHASPAPSFVCETFEAIR